MLTNNKIIKKLLAAGADPSLIEHTESIDEERKAAIREEAREFRESKRFRAGDRDLLSIEEDASEGDLEAVDEAIDGEEVEVDFDEIEEGGIAGAGLPYEAGVPHRNLRGYMGLGAGYETPAIGFQGYGETTIPKAPSAALDLNGGIMLLKWFLGMCGLYDEKLVPQPMHESHNRGWQYDSTYEVPSTRLAATDPPLTLAPASRSGARE